MENISTPEIVLVIISLLGAASPLLLGLLESRNKERRGKADDTLDLSQATKNMIDALDETVRSLRDEISRNKSEAGEREAKLLADLESMEIRIKRNQERVDAVLQNEMEKSRDLEIRLESVTIENEQLRSRLKRQGEHIAAQDKLIAELQAENTELKETIREIKQDVRGIKKLQTGELKKRESGDAG